MIYMVFLHGSGGSGPELRSYLDCVPLTAFNYQSFHDIAKEYLISYETPTARQRPYSAAFGEISNVWFDRSDRWSEFGRLDPFEDCSGTEESIEQILRIVSSIPNTFESIFIGGHSMGGGVSLQLLRKNLPPRVKGIFSIGSFAVKASMLFSAPIVSGTQVPVLMMHGTDDPLVLLEWGRETATDLTIRGVDVEFRSYDGRFHDFDDEQLSDLLKWIVRIGNDSSSSLPAVPHNADSEPESAPSLLPEFSTECLDSGRSLFRVTYPVPQDMAALLVTRPVLACGAAFELSICNEGVTTTFSSADPEKTAREIGLRLRNRVSCDGDSLNACPMS